MYQIVLKTWYQETPETRYDEVYLEFETMEDAARYLGNNIDSILNEFPVDGEINIKYNKK